VRITSLAPTRIVLRAPAPKRYVAVVAVLEPGKVVVHEILPGAEVSHLLDVRRLDRLHGGETRRGVLGHAHVDSPQASPVVAAARRTAARRSPGPSAV